MASADPEAFDAWLETHIPGWDRVRWLEVDDRDPHRVTAVRLHEPPHYQGTCPDLTVDERDGLPDGEKLATCSWRDTFEVAAPFPFGLLSDPLIAWHNG